ncbi:hypothetical protein [Kutzneria buriramensis]|uniref:Uncharacterized protein n=1 Tax=Kutzneria buriramensis TaxID=1045776 RepID=A0A3E0GV40_9PSEU|nr:hypothetical protein BCF44_13124 [Kutzneria buriramensis]
MGWTPWPQSNWSNVEREFDIELTQEQLAGMATLSGVIAVVMEATGW